MSSIDSTIRLILLRLRVHLVDGPAAANPNSIEYLYLVQQSKRISLSATVGRFSRRNVLFWPFLLALTCIKWLDLSLTTSLIKSFINELALERLSSERPRLNHENGHDAMPRKGKE